ncbi:MAG: SCO family protein [Bacteroidales bacterium]|nr:SCO family protein [Bacteroidales bacterium]MCF8405983.1 SCO family protein [Bacteroidales bacterium]
MKKILYLTGFLILASMGHGYSQTPGSDVEIGFIEKQGQYVALDTKLVNEQGDTVLLKDLLAKPTILNLVYFRCPGTCSPLMFGVNKFIQEVDLDFGTDYQVLTISFDPTETIELGIKKKASYINLLEDKSLERGWHFFVTDSANIAKITESVGFKYKWVNDQYSHPTGLIALSPDGKITRYLRGIEFPPFDIKITMVEAGQGKVGPSINRLLAFCYSYDEDGDQMVFNITKVSGSLIMFFGIVIFLILLFFRRKPIKSA